MPGPNGTIDLESFLYLLLMCLAAFGAGSAVVRWLGPSLEPLTRYAVSAAIGIGVIGWLTFFLALTGHIGRPALIGLLVALALPAFSPLVLAAGRAPRTTAWGRAHSPWQPVLLICIAVVLVFDLAEGLAPPVDGDSLAYHFAIPKAVLAEGRLFPIYHAIEGTIPLLHQMTYLVALGTGGETTMTLWTMASGWVCALLVFVISRQFLSRGWALALALLFLTTPAVLYSAGSGHIEVRNAMFVLVAALAVAKARQLDCLKFAALAGIAAGLFMAAKYTGMIFVFACGVALLMQRRWFVHSCVFSIVALITGAQWYAWNFWITGDPIFPLLFGVIEYPPHVPWNADIHEAYRMIIQERAVPADTWWFFAYPVAATLFANPVFESLRVGFGPFVLLIAPATLLGMWAYRARLFHHPLFSFGVICLVAYAVWFFTGPSQRVRHLLPLYPILLICFATAAHRATVAWSTLSQPLYLVFFLVLPLHGAGTLLYSGIYLQRLVHGESRDSFLRRTVSEYDAVTTIQKDLRNTDRLFVSNRQLVYLFDTPVFCGNAVEQAVIEVHAKIKDPSRLWSQFRNQQITHVLLPFILGRRPEPTKYEEFLLDLERRGCITTLMTFHARFLQSRTLPSLHSGNSPFTFVHLTPDTCKLPAIDR